MTLTCRVPDAWAKAAVHLLSEHPRGALQPWPQQLPQRTRPQHHPPPPPLGVVVLLQGEQLPEVSY